MKSLIEFLWEKKKFARLIARMSFFDRVQHVSIVVENWRAINVVHVHRLKIKKTFVEQLLYLCVGELMNGYMKFYDVCLKLFILACHFYSSLFAILFIFFCCYSRHKLYKTVEIN